MLQHFCVILSNGEETCSPPKGTKGNLAQSYARCFTTFNMTTNVVFYTSRL